MDDTILLFVTFGYFFIFSYVSDDFHTSRAINIRHRVWGRMSDLDLYVLICFRYIKKGVKHDIHIII